MKRSRIESPGRKLFLPQILKFQILPLKQSLQTFSEINMVGSQKNSEPGNLHVRIRVQPPINGPKITGFHRGSFSPRNKWNYFTQLIAGDFLAGIIELPIWRDQTKQTYGNFEGFPLNSALFGLGSYNDPCFR